MWLLQILSDFERAVLLAINGANSPALNDFMWLYSGKWIWVPFYVLLFALVVRKYRSSWRSILAISICISLVILLTDQMCASWIRPLVQRDRPSHSEIGPLLHFINGYKGGNYGFPSCHAANTAALTAFLCCVLRSRAIAGTLILWALLMGYSRMYLGVHYPSDILMGYLCGAGVGIAFGQLFARRDTILARLRPRLHPIFFLRFRANKF